MQRALILVVVLLLVGFLFATFIRRTGMFFPERHPLGTWDTSRLPIQPADEWFTTSDGVKLHGWWFGSAPTALVWCHGNGGNITHRAEIAAELARRGVSVFLFDWRGYGQSEGSPSEAKLYRDALAAHDHAARKAQTIVMYGESLGGPYAAYVAKHRKVRSVILENTMPSLRELGNALYRPIPLGWFAPMAMRTTVWLNEAGVPVLVIHGKRDAVIPFELGQRLYDGLRVPKEMLVSETAGHSEVPFVEGVRYYDRVIAFALGVAPAGAPRPPAPH